MSEKKYIIPSELPIPEEHITHFSKIGKFPVLYSSIKRGNKEKIRYWMIKVEQNDIGHGIISREYGDKGGKKQKPKVDVITKGKNIGRSNETTPYTQAIKQATSYFRKKLKEKYFPNESSIKNTVKISPMLAFDYEKKEKYLIFPCAGQRKLDGVRCLARFYKNKVILYKRSMDIINECLFKGIRKELLSIFTIFPDVWLDGEIYKHGIPLQKINIIGRKTIKNEDIKFMESIKFNIYDCFFLKKLDLAFIKRFGMLFYTFKKNNNKFNHITLVRTIKINNKKEIKEKLETFSLKENYEGIILRNELGVYKIGGRSTDLLKYKPVETDEFMIVDINHIKGEDLFRITLTLTLVDGVKFDVNGNGTEEYRKRVYKNKDWYIGRYLRISYYGTTKDRIPKFAVPNKDPKTNEYETVVKDKNGYLEIPQVSDTGNDMYDDIYGGLTPYTEDEEEDEYNEYDEDGFLN